MGFVIGRGRRASETYPERSVAGGSPGVIDPFSNLAYVDVGTSVPAPDQTGSVAAPFSTVQAAVDAGFQAVYMTGDFSAETVTASFLILTGANVSAGILGLVIADLGFAQIDKVSLSNLTVGDGATVITNVSVGDAAFGDTCFLVLNGPGALSFPARVDQLSLSSLTMGPGGTLIATNAVFSGGATIVADTIELFGCASPAGAISCITLNAKNCAFTSGDYTTTGEVDLQDCTGESTVTFLNALGQEFRLDGYTNYWFTRNTVSFSNAGEKIVTEDLTP